jgi:hypothetical protein
VRRAFAWAGATALVVLAARTIAYAAEPSPLAVELRGQAGGPRLWTIAVAALAIGVGIAAAVVWLATLAVEERRRLEPRRLLDAPRRPHVGCLLARTVALWAVSCGSFALLESTLHWRAGLGWHGLSCLTGPVHRDALPILLALSLVAAACAAAAEHVVAWMRRTLARLAAAFPLPRLLDRVAAPVLAPLLVVRAPLGARGPPVVAR